MRAKPCADSTVVAKGSVAVQLNELVAHQIDIINGLRTVCVTSNKDCLPRRQRSVATFAESVDLPTDLPNLFLVGRFGAILDFHPIESQFHLMDILFKWQWRDH